MFTLRRHSIIYNRCLHETGMKNVQTDLKSSRPLDRADYLQTGTNPERDECEHKYISGWSAVALSASEQRMLDKAL